MQFGISVFTTATGAPPQILAKKAEDLGFESFFVSEHSHIPLSTQFPMGGDVPLVYKSMYDPFIALTAAAAVTSKIRLGTAICILPQHDPLNCAKATASLDQISNGRLELGIGAGWNAAEMEQHGAPFSERFSRTKETIEAIQALWQDDVAEYHGKHINIEPSWMYPKPQQQPHPPVLLAGAGPSILKRTVSIANGWLPVISMEWHESLAGKQTRREGLPADIKILRELEEQMEKPKTTISAMGLPPTPEYIEFLLENEVERMILSIPSDDEAGAFAHLEQIAAAIAQYKKAA
ncbi:MAG: putative F420-dependent oxidoreductase [Candidatus Azotimanducaceae bacterium]|jgi:probable F420-dependent oxidoreductase